MYKLRRICRFRKRQVLHEIFDIFCTNYLNSAILLYILFLSSDIYSPYLGMSINDEITVKMAELHEILLYSRPHFNLNY